MSEPDGVLEKIIHEIEDFEEKPSVHVVPDWISRLFRLGMWWRIIYGAARILLGIAFLQVLDREFSDVIAGIMEHELAEDPGDILYTFTGVLVRHTTFLHQPHFDFTVSYFLVAYFFFWGTIDIFISIGILRERYWAYSAGMALIVVFIVYEIARVFHTRSLILAGIILLDLGILALLRREQKIHLAALEKKQAEN